MRGESVKWSGSHQPGRVEEIKGKLERSGKTLVSGHHWSVRYHITYADILCTDGLRSFLIIDARLANFRTYLFDSDSPGRAE